ncbi:MAG: zinc-binding dehydrogenase [Phycisphaerales bacterium]
MRANWEWVTPLPKGIDPAKAGPLFCGGITVFNPIVQNSVKPTDRVGVIGIGGLGHLALQFLNAWGCEVVAFTSSDAKAEEARKLGAHRTVNSRDDKQVASVKGELAMIINTANADLNWGAYIEALAPGGKLHTVGVVPSPIAVHSFPLIAGQKSIGGSPLGSPATIETMLEFCGRHGINAVTETFKMSKANEALHHLESGKARYRIVLEQDL